MKHEELSRAARALRLLTKLKGWSDYNRLRTSQEDIDTRISRVTNWLMGAYLGYVRSYNGLGRVALKNFYSIIGANTVDYNGARILLAGIAQYIDKEHEDYKRAVQFARFAGPSIPEEEGKGYDD